MNPKVLPRIFARTLHLLFIAGFALGLALPTQAASFTVDSTTDAVDAFPGDGLCATSAGECTLRAVIQETNALAGPDTITLPTGSYLLSIPGANEDAAAVGDLDITDDLILTGAGLGLTVIDGNGTVTLDRVFHIPASAVVTLSGMTIMRGGQIHQAIFGGGISNSGTLTINQSRLSRNSAWGGGGLYQYGSFSTVTLTNSTLSRNSAILGGAIYADNGTLSLIDSTLSGNSAENQGGGIYNRDMMTLINSTLSGNSAVGSGGGIYNLDRLNLIKSTLSGNSATYEGGGVGGVVVSFGILRVTNSTLSGNWSTFGGGIQNATGGTAMVTSSTISGNSADYGGGIENYGTLTLSNSTLSDNSATAWGGAIYNSDGAVSRVANSTLSGNSADIGGGISNIHGTVRLGNSILAGNAGPSPDCKNTVNSSGYNLVGDNTGCNFIPGPGDQVGTGDNPIYPLLGPLQDNGGPTFTHALLESSPAIDAGNPDECPPTDQRGAARPMDGDGDGSAICDIGAYELEEAP